MKVSIVAFTEAGAKLCGTLVDLLPVPCEGFAPERFAKDTVKPLIEPIDEWTGRRFIKGDALVFIGATGIAVRAIAPFLSDKQHDPAVVALDELGRFVTPLLSGHIGGANRLAREIAELTHGTAIISTATDVNGIWSPDVWASENGYTIANIEAVKTISAALLQGEVVGLDCDFPIDNELPENIILTKNAQAGIVISLEKRRIYPITLNIIPKCLTIGVGCRKGVESDLLERKITVILENHNLPIESVGRIATIDRKADEPAILDFCRKYSLVLDIYTAEELAEVRGEFDSSEMVQKTVGVDNVCERAAVCAKSSLIVPKTTGDGVALAIAKQNWRIGF